MRFNAPFPEVTSFRLELPEGLSDDAGRPLANAANFPLQVKTAEFPPLAKFSARFGIIEWRADPALPVTVRQLEADLHLRLRPVGQKKETGTPQQHEATPDQAAGKRWRLPPEQVGEVIAWLRRVAVTRRDVSIFNHLGSDTTIKAFQLPKPHRAEPLEVIGIPLDAPGLHIVELASPRLGSALKPFLYGLALERRLLTPASLLEDTPLDISVAGGLYRPRNYDEQFRGLTTMRTALAASLNSPAVRILELVGTDAFVQQLRSLGLEGAVESGDYYGPALALGSVDASLWELVNAYRTLANGGVRSALRLVPGTPRATAAHRVYSEATSFLLSHILSDRESRSPAFGLENPLATRFWSAVKTGTSKEMRDNWCVGYTRHYTVGV